jgi:hypothetical protein
LKPRIWWKNSTLRGSIGWSRKILYQGITHE